MQSSDLPQGGSRPLGGEEKAQTPPVPNSVICETLATPPQPPARTALVQRSTRAWVRTRSPSTHHHHHHQQQQQQQQQRGGVISLLPMHTATLRVVIGVGKAGISIVDALLLPCKKILNPIIPASFVLYETSKLVQACRHGDLNRLGYRTTNCDVALCIG